MNRNVIARHGLMLAVVGLACGCAGTPAGKGNEGAAAAAELACTLPTNCVSSVDGGVPPLAFRGTPQQALAALKATLAAFPEATLQGATEQGLEAVFTTPSGFRDEVAFRIDTARQRIDYRSRSGLGLYDFGKNRSRMAEFAARFEQAGAR